MGGFFTDDKDIHEDPSYKRLQTLSSVSCCIFYPDSKFQPNHAHGCRPEDVDRSYSLTNSIMETGVNMRQCLMGRQGKLEKKVKKISEK